MAQSAIAGNEDANAVRAAGPGLQREVDFFLGRLRARQFDRVGVIDLAIGVVNDAGSGEHIGRRQVLVGGGDAEDRLGEADFPFTVRAIVNRCENDEMGADGASGSDGFGPEEQIGAEGDDWLEEHEQRVIGLEGSCR